MEYQVLPKVEDRIQQYRTNHHGESPLYMIMAAEEADHLINEVKSMRGYDNRTVVTEFNGIKIVKSELFNNGDIHLTDELPETGS